jgi:hypothetical protein
MSLFALAASRRRFMGDIGGDEIGVGDLSENVPAGDIIEADSSMNSYSIYFCGEGGWSSADDRLRLCDL